LIEWTPPYDSSRHHVPESLSVKKTGGVRGKA
jgi:hypothetical protein